MMNDALKKKVLARLRRIAGQVEGIAKVEPSASEPPVAPGVVYTCPMHPETVRDAPGSCPICGMTLEPRTALADVEDDAELVDMRRRFWLAAALTLPLVFLAMGDMLPGHRVSSLMSSFVLAVRRAPPSRSF